MNSRNSVLICRVLDGSSLLVRLRAFYAEAQNRVPPGSPKKGCKQVFLMLIIPKLKQANEQNPKSPNSKNPTELIIINIIFT